ncbi:hypothetical protein PRIC2_011433 [Phytophthora ramorum]
MSTTSTSSSVASCSSSVLSSLLTDQYISQCSTDSGYSFTDASIPTQDVIDLMCASSACLSLLADAQALNLSECILPVGDNILLLADLIDYVPPRCPSASGSAATTAGSTATDNTVSASSTAGNATASSSSSNTVTVPSPASSATTSTASSGETSTSAPSSGTSAASAATSASAASSSSGSSAAASPVGRAMGLVSITALAVATYCL